jgi:hypothetical protein
VAKCVVCVLPQLKIFNYAGGDEEVEAAFKNEVSQTNSCTNLQSACETASVNQWFNNVAVRLMCFAAGHPAQIESRESGSLSWSVR